MLQYIRFDYSQKHSETVCQSFKKSAFKSSRTKRNLENIRFEIDDFDY